MRSDRDMAWVVYEFTLPNGSDPRRAVCTQPEWAKIEADRPGHHKLVEDRIPSEGHAERLARGVSGDKKAGAMPKRTVKPEPRVFRGRVQG